MEEPVAPQPPTPIEDYGLLGDTRTAALCRLRRFHRLAVHPTLRWSAGVRPAGRRSRRGKLPTRPRRPATVVLAATAPNRHPRDDLADATAVG